MWRRELNGSTATPKFTRHFYASTPLRKTNEDDDDVDESEYALSEWKLAIIGLIVSLVIIGIKLVHLNNEYLYNLLTEKRLISYEVIAQDGQLMFTHAWKTAVKYSSVWLPALCGLLVTWFTWLMVYLDSSVPGIEPPSPLSPTKYKVRSGHTFHLNYIFTVLVGFMVFMYLYNRGTSLEFN